MAISERSDLFAKLAQGDADAVLGTAESDWLDFKSQPYNLSGDDGKLELVKDVTALANSNGGVIVIGYKTEKQQGTKLDVASAVSRVRRDVVNWPQYLDVIESRTHPPFRDLSYRWWLEQGEFGVLTIEVKAANDADKPILVVKAREDGSRREILFGIFQRYNDRITKLTPGEIHTRLQLGSILQQGGFVVLPPNQVVLSGPSEDERLQRLEEDTIDSERQSDRRYFLQAWPLPRTEVKDIHKQGSTGLRHVLSDPPQIRQHGFGLGTGAMPSLLPGVVLRVNDQIHSLSLQRNGLLTWITSAGEDFLARLNPPALPQAINPLVLVESTFEFVRLFTGEILSRCEPRPARWSISGGMRRLLDREFGGPALLAPGPLGSLFPDWQKATGSDFDIETLEFNEEAPGAVAFSILREIYSNFGIDESDIPYTQAGEVSEDLIRNVK